jgi:hypothetical protein
VRSLRAGELLPPPPFFGPKRVHTTHTHTCTHSRRWVKQAFDLANANRYAAVMIIAQVRVLTLRAGASQCCSVQPDALPGRQ